MMVNIQHVMTNFGRRQWMKGWLNDLLYLNTLKINNGVNNVYRTNNHANINNCGNSNPKRLSPDMIQVTRKLLSGTNFGTCISNSELFYIFRSLYNINLSI